MKDHPWLESTRIQQKGREGGEKPREARQTSEEDDEQNQVTKNAVPVEVSWEAAMISTKQTDEGIQTRRTGETTHNSRI